MPKREYGKWSSEDMKNAIKEYQNGNIGFNECCRKYEIPKPTFKRHLLKQVKRGEKVPLAQNKRRVNGRESALPEEMEQELVSHILKFEELLFGLTITDVRKLAYDILAAHPHLQNPFNKEKKIAGKKWYYAFMSRHPNLTLRQPENISMARCKGFNRTNVYEFFDVLERIVDENGIDAFHIYNVDESGFSTVQKKSPKVLALKGKHQVGFVASGERGINTTLVCCCNAVGTFVPPMFIFKRQRMHTALKNGAFPGSIVEASESGYINTELFVEWLQHFIKFVKPSQNEKIILLLDGHTTHSKNLEAIKLARENGIMLLQLPGHTTHRLQPLDVGVFKSVEANYMQVMTTWLRTNVGQKVTQFEVAALLTEAYTNSATISNAVNGFKASGIWPVNRNVFSETDFVASENLLIPETAEPEKEDTSVEATDVPAENYVNLTEEDPVPSTSGLTQQEKLRLNKNSKSVSIAQLSPLPKIVKKLGERAKKGAQKVAILTESPYKNELEAKYALKVRKEELKKAKESAKKEIFQPEKSKQKTKTTKPSKENKKIIIETNPDDWFCTICQECRVEDMIKCFKCGKWAHEMCSDLSRFKDDYVCDFCLET